MATCFHFSRVIFAERARRILATMDANTLNQKSEMLIDSLERANYGLLGGPLITRNWRDFCPRSIISSRMARHDDEVVICLMRRTVNTPNPSTQFDRVWCCQRRPLSKNRKAMLIRGSYRQVELPITPVIYTLPQCRHMASASYTKTQSNNQCKVGCVSGGFCTGLTTVWTICCQASTTVSSALLSAVWCPPLRTLCKESGRGEQEDGHLCPTPTSVKFVRIGSQNRITACQKTLDLTLYWQVFGSDSDVQYGYTSSGHGCLACTRCAGPWGGLHARLILHWRGLGKIAC